MKDVLKVMRFDLLTASPAALPAFVFAGLLCFLLSLFISPIMNSYIALCAMLFIIPLQKTADKCGFNKLYGIIPVKRKNITRARFFYLFTVFFLSELMSAVFEFIDLKLRLYRILPNQDTETVQMISDGYAEINNIIIMTAGMTMTFCFLFSYMEMMGQIFGRENEMKIILISLAVLTALAVGFMALVSRSIIPPMNIKHIPDTAGEWFAAAVILNFAVFVMCIIFGEITANKLAKREL